MLPNNSLNSSDQDEKYWHSSRCEHGKKILPCPRNAKTETSLWLRKKSWFQEDEAVIDQHWGGIKDIFGMKVQEALKFARK